mmetsp:Transcript_17653/g.26809  ORF Transcript_17653/g.26809 Transcript_17653/m.26809 type:complete len:81 (-) Transcript_17653:158-400(-)
MASSTIISFFLFVFFSGSVNSFFTPAASSWGRLQSTSLAVSPQDDGDAKNVMLRREMMQKKSHVWCSSYCITCLCEICEI